LKPLHVLVYNLPPLSLIEEAVKRHLIFQINVLSTDSSQLTASSCVLQLWRPRYFFGLLLILRVPSITLSALNHRNNHSVTCHDFLLGPISIIICRTAEYMSAIPQPLYGPLLRPYEAKLRTGRWPE
jgi:hypothetical protein